MTVNNETGVIQPIKEIGALLRKHKGVYFHTDAAQAVGKIPVDVNEMNVDLMSISGHKIYGPKGVGACYVRRRPRVRLEPILSGGGQERGLRSGTLPTPLVVGLGEAARIAKREMQVSTLVPVGWMMILCTYIYYLLSRASLVSLIPSWVWLCSDINAGVLTRMLWRRVCTVSRKLTCCSDRETTSA